MKIAFLNTWSHGSSGSIIRALAEGAKARGHESIFITSEPVHGPHPFSSVFVIQNGKVFHKIRRLETLFKGNEGFCRKGDTKRIIDFLRKESPSLIHIHTIHGTFLDIDAITLYAQNEGIPVIWTLHDQWILTGRCACPAHHCNKWQSGCHRCPKKHLYPRGITDFASTYWKRKEELVRNRRIFFVCPSQWLAGEFRTRFPGCNIQVVNNGIPLLREVPSLSVPFHANGKFVVLTAAYRLNANKGIEEFCRLAGIMQGEKDILFVGVGADRPFSKNNLLLLPRQDDKMALQAIYAKANCFINLTHFDNYPTVNIEALSMGTPVITRNVGGAAEMIKEGINGFSLSTTDLEAYSKAILKLKNSPLDRDEIRKDSMRFSEQRMIEQYLDIYALVTQ